MSVTPIDVETPPIVEARPRHADFAGMLKYGTDDLRNILERSSARNTATLVAIGAVCRCLLAACGIRVMSHVAILGGIRAEIQRPPDYADLSRRAEDSPVRVAESEAEQRIFAAIDEAGARGDTLG